MATEVTLRDGTAAMTWSLLPEDRRELAEAYEKLDPESRYHRFLTAVPHLSGTLLHHLVDEVDGVDHVALVLFVFDQQGNGEPAGVARMIRYPDDPTAADVAVTVAPHFRGRGVAAALLDELLVERPQGVQRVVTKVAGDNAAAVAMLRRLGPTEVTSEGDNVLDVVVSLPDPQERP